MHTTFRARRWIVLGAATLLTAVAHAHHSFAVFFDDEQGLVKVEGTVTEFSFRNPHGLIRVETVEKGKKVEWRAETNSPSILERRGWKRDSLKVGDKIVLEGWKARDGSRYMRMRKVTMADGTPIGIPFETPEVR